MFLSKIHLKKQSHLIVGHLRHLIKRKVLPKLHLQFMPIQYVIGRAAI